MRGVPIGYNVTLNISQLARLLNVSVITLRKFLDSEGIRPGGDATSAIKMFKKKWVTYSLNGDKVTQYQVSKMLNCSPSTVYNRFKAAGVKPGDKVDALVENLKNNYTRRYKAKSKAPHPNTKLYRYRGELLSMRKIALLADISPGTVAKRVRDNNLEQSDDITTIIDTDTTKALYR